MKDYRWQWVSFLGSASTAGYVYLYAVYYFFKRTHMSGILQVHPLTLLVLSCSLVQVTFYFGYTAMLCFGLALLTGAAGFLGTRMFVHRIFRAIHVD